MIISLLYKNSPEDLRLILIDPKMVELSSYDDIPHLAMPVITDSKLASQALKWAVEEMERRFVLFNNMHLKNIVAYNKKVDEEGGKKMPYIVIIIDELSDLMMVAANEVESHIQRLTQKPEPRNPRDCGNATSFDRHYPRQHQKQHFGTGRLPGCFQCRFADDSRPRRSGNFAR